MMDNSREKRYLRPETIDLFTSRAYPNTENRRGLGFDKPSLDTIPSERYPSKKCSKESFGHSGFTGNLVWVDPINQCFMIFLSNRVYPTREQKNLYRLKIRGSIVLLLKKIKGFIPPFISIALKHEVNNM